LKAGPGGLHPGSVLAITQQPDGKAHLPQAYPIGAAISIGDGRRAVIDRTADNQGEALLTARGGDERHGHQQHGRQKKAHDPPDPTLQAAVALA